MTALALVVGALLVCACVAYVALPFLREPDPEDDVLAEPGALERRALELAEERDRALAALKELEFDHRTGKISDDDYRELVGPLRRRVADALRALELRAESKEEAVSSLSASGPGEGRGNRSSPELRATAGTELPPNSKFCLECGTAVAAGDTVVEEVPVPEPAPAPVEPQVAERRLFGVPPSSILLLLVVVALVFAIVLFALGEWPWALIVLGLAGFAATGLFTQARRLPAETSGRDEGVARRRRRRPRARPGRGRDRLRARERPDGALQAPP